MLVQTFFLRGRIRARCLIALALLAFLAIDSTPAAAWTKAQIARHERYLACKARITKDPPCNQVYTRYCARQCRAIFW